MRTSVKIKTELYESIRKRPLFFVKYVEYIAYDENGIPHNLSVWRSVDRGTEIEIPATSVGHTTHEYILYVIDGAFYDKPHDRSQVVMELHEASASNPRDLFLVIWVCIVNYGIEGNKLAFVELLWFLNKNEINTDALSSALKEIGDQAIPTVLRILKRICRCLSASKQNEIASLFRSFGSCYEPYVPKLIIDALQQVNPLADRKNLNLFQLVDEIIGHDTPTSPPMLKIKSDNPFVQLKQWFYSEDGLRDYNILIPVFSMVSEPVRLAIVKRYFHDIRLGHTQLDVNLLMQFKDNKYGDFIRYRYVTETPADRLVLTVPLLCDSLLTIYNSKGERLQDFNGILDLAIVNCDKTHPGIDFKLDRIFPVCDHGAVYNLYRFNGFIDYQLVYKTDVETLTDERLFECIRECLDLYCTRKRYPICKYDKGKRIGKEKFEMCSKGIGINGKVKLNCYEYRQYDDRWSVNTGNDKVAEVLNSFLKKDIAGEEVNLSMVSADVFRNYILSLLSSFEKLDNEEFLVPSCVSDDMKYKHMLIKRFSDIVKVRILPCKEVLVSRKFDVFGYWKEQRKTLPRLVDINSPEYEEAVKRYRSQESAEVYRRTVESLKKMLGVQEYNGDYFEIAYNKGKLAKILNMYYFKGAYKDKDDISVHEFLTSPSVNKKFPPSCAPQLSEANVPAIDLPFFWCRGNECFHNNLGQQTLSETKDWRAYYIYHLMEIIGYPKLHETIAGNEPDATVRSFLAVTYKVIQKFHRMKCRSCGHLMFTDKSSGYNRYNYYSCINPACIEFRKPVYLNYCFKCKKGLIDSRDTKKCPNGWYICPDCLSCCDDMQYERQAQRYILTKHPVPERIKKMLGHGHGDKGECFCPKCGGPLNQDENAFGHYTCPSCHSEYKKRI